MALSRRKAAGPWPTSPKPSPNAIASAPVTHNQPGTTSDDGSAFNSRKSGGRSGSTSRRFITIGCEMRMLDASGLLLPGGSEKRERLAHEGVEVARLAAGHQVAVAHDLSIDDVGASAFEVDLHRLPC